MNKVVLLGRLTKDPDVRYSQGSNPTAVARYTLAVDRRFKRDGETPADFINCVAFGKPGELTGKHLRKGSRIAVVGRIKTDNYTNKDGQRVYTTDVVVDEMYFCENRASQQRQSSPKNDDDMFFEPIDPITDEDLPF